MRSQALRTTRAVLLEDGRDVALELRRLVHGDLCGMFDGPTTAELRLDGPLVVLDLSAVYHSPALGVLMACAAAWLQSAVRSQHRNRIIVVVDEAWAILSNLGVARWLQTSWKLSRANGVANMAVLHRLSDLRSVGTEGSEQVNLAEGLLADSETRVVYAQSPGEVIRTGELLGLTDTEAELVTQLRRGMALWKVGRRSFLVEHRLASSERWLTDTDQAMTDQAMPTGGPGRREGPAGHRRRDVGVRRGRPARPGPPPPGAPRPGLPRSGARRPSPLRPRRRTPSPVGGSGPGTAGEGHAGPAAGISARWSSRGEARVRFPGADWSSAGRAGGWWPRSGPNRSSSSGPPSRARRRASPFRPSWAGRGRSSPQASRPISSSAPSTTGAPAARSSVFDPSGSTGPASVSWSPLPAARTWPGARRAAAGLTEVARASVGHDERR